MKHNLPRISTVTEIREAIKKLNAEERELLIDELLETRLEAHENTPEFRAAIDEVLPTRRLATSTR